MKRTKFILLALIAAMVLMGAGYAAWTQTFTISSTVDTGELFVKVAETHVVDVNNGTVDTNGNPNYTTAGNSYLDISNIVQSTSADNAAGNQTTLSTLTYDVGKVYPGTRITSTLTFNNMGTMKAKTTYNATSSSVTNAGSALWHDLIFKVNGEPVDVTGDEATVKENISAAIKTAIGDIDQGQTKTVIIVQELPLSSTNSTEQLSLAWTLALGFEQYNSAN